MRDHLRKLQEMSSDFLSLLGFGKNSSADDSVAVSIDVARRQRETATTSDAELVEFLDRCVEASEIQRLHYATGEAVTRLVAGDFECRTATVETQQAATADAPSVSDPGLAMASNVRELRPRMANPFDTAETLMAEAKKKVEEGRRDSEARIEAITQRATDLSAEVESLRSEVASRDVRMSELEQKLADGELANREMNDELEVATKRIASLIRDAGVHEAARKSQIRLFVILLGVAGTIVTALLLALAR